MGRYIEHVDGNFKLLRPCQLGRKTLIIGPNGSGKSSIIDGISLALTGETHSGFGKALALASSGKAGSGEDPRVEVTLSDGEALTWPRPRDHSPGHYVVSSAEAREAFKSPGRLREFVLGAMDHVAKLDAPVDAGSALAELASRVPTHYREVCAEVIEEVRTIGVTGYTEALNGVLSIAACRVKSLNAKIKAAEGDITEWDELSTQIIACEAEVDRLKPEAEQDKSRVRKYRTMREALRHSVSVVDTLGELVGADDSLKCPCCGSSSTMRKLQEAKSRASAAVDELNPYMEKTEAEVKLLNAVENWKSLLRQRESLKTTESVVWLTSNRDAADGVGRAAKQLLGERSESVADLASMRVNRLLPAGVHVEFWVRAQGLDLAVSVDEAEARPYHLHGGAVKAIVGAAVASAFSSPTADLRVLAVDDVWLDRPAVTTLIRLLDQAAESGTDQVILSAVEYGGKPPAGWVIISVGNVRQREVPKESKSEPETESSQTPGRSNWGCKDWR